MIRKSTHISDLLLAAILVMAGFCFVFWFLAPVINSDDDVFLMYQLSGGFGNEPDNLLHFDHIIHPWLGFLLASLFRLQPEINWYSWFLIFIQFISWVILGKCLFSIFGKKTGTLILFLLFLLAGINGLHSLNISSSSWVFSLAIMTWLVCFPRSVIFCFILFLVAGSIRLQIPMIVAGLFIPVLWIKREQVWWKPIFFFLTLLLFLFFLNLSHKYYYKNHIPGWESAEKQRQDLFYSFNRPKDLQKPDSLIYQNNIEKAFYKRLFLFDVNFPGGDRLKKIGKENVRFRDFTQKEDREVLYWTWRGWRLYFLYLFVAMVVGWYFGILWAWIKKAWFPVSGLILFYLFLFVFFKFTDAFFMGVMLALALQLIVLLPKENVKVFSWIFPGWLFLIPMAWSLNREFATDDVYRDGWNKFKCSVREMERFSKNLFIATGDAVPVKYFQYSSVPVDYPLHNYIFKERILTNTYHEVFRQYGLSDDIKKDLHHHSISLAGPEFPELIKWLAVNGDTVMFSSIDRSFNCLEVRKLLVK